MNALRGVAKFGIALGSGPRGRGFKSRHSDHRKPLISCEIGGFHNFSTEMFFWNLAVLTKVLTCTLIFAIGKQV